MFLLSLFVLIRSACTCLDVPAFSELDRFLETWTLRGWVGALSFLDTPTRFDEIICRQALLVTSFRHE